MKAKFLRTALLIVPAMLLAACGGGGGGDSATSTSSATPLVITSANSKPVSAEAVDSSVSTDSVSTGSTLLTGAQVSGAGSSGSALRLVSIGRMLMGKFEGVPALATGAAFEDTFDCNNPGGTLRFSGNVADVSGSMLQAGDTLTITASNCQSPSHSGTETETLNGTLTLRVTSGIAILDPVVTYPFQLTMSMTFTNFSVAEGAETETANGDITVAISAASDTAETVTVSGTSLGTTHTKNGVTRSVTLKNYSMKSDVNNGVVTQTVTATVESNNTRLGSGLVSYQISTVTPITVNSSGVVTAGVLKITGGNNTSVLVSVTGSDAFKLEVDDNGDGKIESSSDSSKLEFESLL